MWSTVSPFRNDEGHARLGARGRALEPQYPSLPRLPAAAVAAAAEAAAANKSEGRFHSASTPTLARLHRPLLSLFGTIVPSETAADASTHGKVFRGRGTAVQADASPSRSSGHFSVTSLTRSPSDSSGPLSDGIARIATATPIQPQDSQDFGANITLPASYTNNSADGILDDNTAQPLLSKTLTVFLIECTGLVAADATGKSDPFVRIHFGNRRQETKVIEDDNNPVFDHEFVFKTSSRSPAADCFTLMVYDYDEFGDPELLGEVAIHLNTFEKYSRIYASTLHRGDSRSWVSGWYDLALPVVYQGMHGGSQIYIKWTVEPKLEQHKRQEEALPPPKQTLKMVAPATVEATSRVSTPPKSTAETAVDGKVRAPLLNLDWVYAALARHTQVATINHRETFPTAQHFVRHMQSLDIPSAILPSESTLVRLASSGGLARSPLFALILAAECRLCACKAMYDPGLCNLPLSDLTKICRAGGQDSLSDLFVPYILNRIESATLSRTVARAIPRLLGVLSMIPFGTMIRESVLRFCVAGTIMHGESRDMNEEASGWWLALLASCHGFLRSKPTRQRKEDLSSPSSFSPKKVQTFVNIGIAHNEFWHAIRHRYMPLVQKTPGLTTILKHGSEAADVADLTSACRVQNSISSKHTKPFAMYVSLIQEDEPRTVTFVDTVSPRWYTNIGYAYGPNSVSPAAAASRNVAEFIQILSLVNAAAAQLCLDAGNPARDTSAQSLSTLRDSRRVLSQLRAKMTRQVDGMRLIRVTVVRARDLPVMDAVLHSSDAYVSVHLRGEKQFVTPVRARTLRPIWNDAESTMIVKITKDDEALESASAAAAFEFRMFDQDSSFATSDFTPDADTEDDEIGRVDVSVRDVIRLCRRQDTPGAELSPEQNLDSCRQTYPLKLADGVGAELSPKTSKPQVPTLDIRFEELDLFPTLTVLATRIDKSITFLELASDVGSRGGEATASDGSEPGRNSRALASPREMFAPVMTRRRLSRHMKSLHTQRRKSSSTTVSDESVPTTTLTTQPSEPITLSALHNKQQSAEERSDPRSEVSIIGTVDCARKRIQALRIRPAKTLQDMYGIISLLDQQTLANFSKLFVSPGGGWDVYDSDTAEDVLQQADLIGTGMTHRLAQISGIRPSPKSKSALLLRTPTQRQDQDAKAKETMKRSEALEQTTPVRSSSTLNYEGDKAHEGDFRRGIAEAFFNAGYERPPDELVSELISSLDPENTGYIRWKSLSGVLLGKGGGNAGGRGPAAATGVGTASLKYRDVELLTSGSCFDDPNDEVTTVPHHPDDEIAQMIVLSHTGGESSSDLSYGGGDDDCDDDVGTSDNVAGRYPSFKDTIRLCTRTSIYKRVSIVDVGMSGGRETKVVQNIPFGEVVSCLCACGSTGLIAVATENNDLTFLMGSAGWNPPTSRGMRKTEEKWFNRYRVTNLPFVPVAMHFFHGSLPTPKADSGVSTLRKDMLMLGGRKGQIAVFVFARTWREDAIKFTAATARWPPAYRNLLEERVMITIPVQAATESNIGGAAMANLPIPILTNIQGFSLSESGGWEIVRPHAKQVTQLEYIDDFGAIFSSSEDGTIKISPIEYHGNALDVGESVVVRQDLHKQHERTFSQHGGKPVNGFLYNRDSLTIFSWGWNREILEWNPHSVSKVIRKFYIGASVRSASILRGSAHQHLVVVTVPKHDHRGSDTQMEQKLRIFDVVGGDELQYETINFSSHIRAGSVSSAPKREIASLVTVSGLDSGGGDESTSAKTLSNGGGTNGALFLGTRSALRVMNIPRKWAPVGSLKADGTLVGADEARGKDCDGSSKSVGVVAPSHAHIVAVLYSTAYCMSLTVDSDATLRAWDLQSGCHVHTWSVGLSESGASVCCASLDSAGRTLLAGFSDGSVKLVHAFSGELLASLKVPSSHRRTENENDTADKRDDNDSDKDEFGEITVLKHIKMNGKHFVCAMTSGGYSLFWNLGDIRTRQKLNSEGRQQQHQQQDEEGRKSLATGHETGLVVGQRFGLDPIRFFSMRIHRGLIMDMFFRETPKHSQHHHATNLSGHGKGNPAMAPQEDHTSDPGIHHNNLFTCSLDGVVSVWHADRVGQPVISESFEDPVMSLVALPDRQIMFAGLESGKIACLYTTPSGARLFEKTVKICTDQDGWAEMERKVHTRDKTKSNSNGNESSTRVPCGVSNLALASQERLIATVGMWVRVFRTSKFPRHLPRDIAWAECLEPVNHFCIPCDCDEIQSLAVAREFRVGGDGDLDGDGEEDTIDVLILGGTRVVQVFTIEGHWLGKFGDEFAWQLDDPATFRLGSVNGFSDGIRFPIPGPHQINPLAILLQKGHGRNDPAPPAGEEEDTKRKASAFLSKLEGRIKEEEEAAISGSAKTTEQLESEARERRPDKNKELKWSVTLRNSQRKLPQLSIARVNMTAERMKSAKRRRAAEAKEWGQRQFAIAASAAN